MVRLMDASISKAVEMAMAALASRPALVEESPMTFEVSSNYPDSVICTLPNHRAIGKSKNGITYFVAAPRMSRADYIVMRRVKAKVVSELLSEAVPARDGAQQIAEVQRMSSALMSGYKTSESPELLSYLIAHDAVGFGPLSILLEDSANIEEIMANSPTSNLWIYHADYGYCTTNLKFASESDMRYTLNRLLAETGREFGAEVPIIDARLSNGFRVHAQMRPYSQSGAIASIRVNGGRSLDIKGLMRRGTTTPESLAYLWMAIDAGLSVIITGAPSSGKTALLRALFAFVPRSERVVTVEEDVSELYDSINVINSVSLVGDSAASRGTVKDQVLNALRLRPNRLVVGEMRGKEAAEVLAGANFGMPFMATMHCGMDAESAVRRLSMPPMSVPSSTISMLDVSLFIHHEQGKRRSVSHIREYLWLARDEISPSEARRTRSEFKTVEMLDGGAIDMSALGRSKAVREFSKQRGTSAEESLKEFSERVAFLKRLAESPEGTDVPKSVDEYSMMKWMST